MELWTGALNLGLLYSLMALGVYITFRIYDFPDITVDGSFTTGASVAAIVIVSGGHPLIAMGLAFLAGFLAGVLTAIIHTGLKINGLLAGILVMTALYSINLHIMGRSNIPLLNQVTIFTGIENINPGMNSDVWTLIILALVMVILWLGISIFFKTDLGLAMRVTGNNPAMGSANGINTKRMIWLGLGLSNGLVGVSGGLVAQYQGFSDIGLGVGTIIAGLAAVIIGESVLKRKSIYIKILCVFIGSILFRFMIAFALYVGLNPLDLKLITAGFVLLTLYIASNPLKKRLKYLPKWLSMKSVIVGLSLGVFVISGYFITKKIISTNESSDIQLKIGFLQISDHDLLNITRDKFVEELNSLGYVDGENCKIYYADANGDLSILNSILDRFVLDDCDIIVPVSTACTQATVNRIKDRPVVFATVANPFIIGAGESDSVHQQNVTGVYGWVPMGKSLEIIHEIVPGKIVIGSIYDPAHANSVFNYDLLVKYVDENPDVEMETVTISNSSEVYQAAMSLTNKNIDAFVLVPDNIVYSAFESIVKAANREGIPILMSDTERLTDGAMVSYGYDYAVSGIQAAHIVDRVFKGENPADIPFERYEKISFGLNLEVAKNLGIETPSRLLEEATTVFDTVGILIKDERIKVISKDEIRVALFLFNDQFTINEVADGVMHELDKNSFLENNNIVVDRKNAQNEFRLAQAVAIDIVSKKYDYIITLSTPALQVMANANKSIPHIFGFVTDPYKVEVAKSSDDHLPYITGVATLQPVRSTIEMMRILFPDAKKIGMIWNPAEVCSETCTMLGRDVVKEFGFELIEANVSGTGEIYDALNSLIQKDIDLFFTSGDNTVMMGLDPIAQTLREHKIPYFTNSFSDVERGAFFCIGADYAEVGLETGKLARKVIGGADPANIPIHDFVPQKIYINLVLAREYGIVIPEEIIAKATKVKK